MECVHGVFGLLVTDMEPFMANPSIRTGAGVERFDLQSVQHSLDNYGDEAWLDDVKLAFCIWWVYFICV